MASIGDVAAVLRAAMVLVEEAARAVKAADDELETVRASLVATLEASSNPTAHDGLAQLHTIHDRISEALTEMAAGVDTMGTYVTSIASGGNSGSPLTAAGARSPSSGAHGSSVPALRRTFDPSPYLDEMPPMVPKADLLRGSRQGKTEGRWVEGSDDDRDWISGEKDPYHQAATTHWERIRASGEPQPLSVTADVEIKFAMFMRRHTLGKERIVINNPDGPCGFGKPTYRYGCDQLLPRFLPKDARLTVAWPGGEKTYVGGADGD